MGTLQLTFKPTRDTIIAMLSPAAPDSSEGVPASSGTTTDEHRWIYVGQFHELSFVRELNNNYDSAAIGIYNPSGALIGFVPSWIATILAPYMDAGDILLKGQAAGPRGLWRRRSKRTPKGKVWIDVFTSAPGKVNRTNLLDTGIPLAAEEDSSDADKTDQDTSKGTE
ncbi:hypothetical protein BP5796_03101 [Coleophoma crateriformis]|uniref:HIRAN domain-containing protein n=1 Tax=Coleophoma crateriformis TaxID=565419 RepID=A0A3D8SM60_9HELO|nr:hypothetical protein BP5796_03101 [Coleophoma crateriformis]